MEDVSDEDSDGERPQAPGTAHLLLVTKEPWYIACSYQLGGSASSWLPS